MNPPDESVWGSDTDTAKAAQRRYLKDLLNDDKERDALIEARERCLVIWEHLRRLNFPDEECERPLKPPFIESTAQAGTTEEPARYQLMGAQGQPSVIDVRRNILLGTSDVTIAKWNDGQSRLILKKEHPKREAYISGLLSHQLLHQWLVEASPEYVRNEYAHQSPNGRPGNGGELKTYKGHGHLFCSHANRLSKKLSEGSSRQPLFRIAKRANAPAEHRQRIPCSWYGTLWLFFFWDPDAEDLSPEQLQDNRERMARGLEYFDGAVQLVETEKKAPSFNAPFGEDCFDTCAKELGAHDEEHGTRLRQEFYLSMVKHLIETRQIESILTSMNYQLPSREIPNSAIAGVPQGKSSSVRRYMDLEKASAKGDQRATDLLNRCDDGEISVQDAFTLYAQGEQGGEEVDIPAAGDVPELEELYPISKPYGSLIKLEMHLAAAKKEGLNKSQFAKERFGHARGDRLAKHMKKLREAAA